MLVILDLHILIYCQEMINQYVLLVSPRSLLKGRGKCICIARFLWYLTLKALRHGSHSVTCNYTNACLYLVSVHQMAPPQTEVADI